MALTVTCETCGQAMGNPACPACRRPGAPAKAAEAAPDALLVNRRDPQRQHADLDGGRRASDPTLTTRECANRLGVTTAFIIGEIRDGRMDAVVIEREGLRTIYRVSPESLDAYVRRYRWRSNRSAS